MIASPFGTFVDRLLPLQRLTGSFRIAGELLTTEHGVWSGAFGVQALYQMTKAVSMANTYLDGEDHIYALIAEAVAEITGDMENEALVWISNL